MTRPLYEPTNRRDVSSLGYSANQLERRPGNGAQASINSYWAELITGNADSDNDTPDGLSNHFFPKVIGEDRSVDAQADDTIEIIDNTGGYDDGNGDPARAILCNAEGIYLIDFSFHFRDIAAGGASPVGYWLGGATSPGLSGVPTWGRQLVSRHAATSGVWNRIRGARFVQVPDEADEFIMSVSHNAGSTLTLGQAHIRVWKLSATRLGT